MKKFIFLSLFALTSFSAPAQVAGVGTLSQEFRQKVDQEFKAIEDSMVLNISSRSLAFPDYKLAAEDLLKTMKASRANYQKSLSGIEDFLSWYETIATEYERDPHNRAIKNLLQKKKEELKAQQGIYQQASLELVILNGLLSMPVSVSPRPGQYLPATVLAVAAVAVPGGAFAAGAVGAGVFGGSAVFLFLESFVMGASYDVEMSETTFAQWTFGGAVKDSTGRVIYKSNKGGESTREFRNHVLGSVGQRAFGKCQTQGCVYYLAEDLINWIKQTDKMTKRLDIPVDGVRDFKFKLPVAEFKYKKAIDQMADIAANGKRVSF